MDELLLSITVRIGGFRLSDPTPPIRSATLTCPRVICRDKPLLLPQLLA